MKKRYIAIICAACLCVSLLAACGSSAAASSAAVSASEAPVSVLPAAAPASSALPPAPPPGGPSGPVENGTAANTIGTDGDYAGETYTSSGGDENALRVQNATVTQDNATIEKAGGASSSTENGDFYGMNAAVLALDGAHLTLTGGTVTSTAQNGNALFSYGAGTLIDATDTVIRAELDNSGGIMVADGGALSATGLDVQTDGNSSAAIRSDRGGGSLQVNGGTYFTNGQGSPAIYSTADVTARGATLRATASEAIVVEGQNTVVLDNCEVSGNMAARVGDETENLQTVMLYQSTSGDASTGTALFHMTDGSLEGLAGDMFYVTNTSASITLSHMELWPVDENHMLLKVEGNQSARGWGAPGSNGANVVFIGDNQILSGNISVDAISTLEFQLVNESTFEGQINIVKNAAGGTSVGANAVVSIEDGSSWTLTGNCTVSSILNNGVINYNGYTITLEDGSVMQG